MLSHGGERKEVDSESDREAGGKTIQPRIMRRARLEATRGSSCGLGSIIVDNQCGGVAPELMGHLKARSGGQRE